MRIIIYGIGSFSELLYHYLSQEKKYSVIAFCVDKQYITDKEKYGLKVIPFENIEVSYPPKLYYMLVSVGYAVMKNREFLFKKAKKKGYKLINYIHPSVNINNLVCGENNIILENTVIEPFVEIGNNNIIWSSVNISHNVNIKSHSFISSQSLIGGFSIIQNNCFLGFNSIILQNIILEKETLVGANALILKNTKKYCKYMGSPAKVISKHKKNGIVVK